MSRFCAVIALVLPLQNRPIFQKGQKVSRSESSSLVQMTDDMMAHRRWFSNAKRRREEDRRFPVTPGGALKAVPTCTCFPTISLCKQTGFWKFGGKRAGATRLRLGEAATLCSCLLCAAKSCPPAGLGGDLRKTFSSKLGWKVRWHSRHFPAVCFPPGRFPMQLGLPLQRKPGPLWSAHHTWACLDAEWSNKESTLKNKVDEKKDLNCRWFYQVVMTNVAVTWEVEGSWIHVLLSRIKDDQGRFERVAVCTGTHVRNHSLWEFQLNCINMIICHLSTLESHQQHHQLNVAGH